MARKRAVEPERPRLTIPRSEAERIMTEQQEQGRVLLAKAQEVGTIEDHKSWERDLRRWRELGVEALRAIYTTDEPSREFRMAAASRTVIGAPDSQRFEWQIEAVENAINKLESLKDRLQFVTLTDDAAAAGGGGAALREAPPEDAKVFIVHGRNEQVKANVARLLEKAGPAYEVIILHEQPNQGRTIIEKFEDYATSADHAVVLLTADDVGGIRPDAVHDAELQARARQNVVLELGFFAGHLGRSRVTVLYEDGVEIPSDYLGVVYVPLDPGGAWQFALLKELRAAKLNYDLNALG